MGAAKRVLRAIYPFLTAATPVAFLAVRNVAQVTPEQMLAPLLGLLAVTALLLFAGRRLLGSPPLAAILVTLLLIALFTTGPLHQTLVERFGGVMHWPAFALSAALSTGLLFGAWRYARANPAREEAITSILSIMSLVLFLNMSLRLAAPDKREIFLDPDRIPFEQGPREHPVLAAESAQFPDIYYIIADGYAREDALQRYYGYDNSEFSAWLESRGFYVARESWSNYPMTFMSLASSLNMRFVNDDAAQIVERRRGASEYDRTPFYRLIQRAEVPERLQQKGYRYAQTLTHWGGTDRSGDADIRYKFAPFLGDEFAGTLANMTLLRVVSPTLDQLHHFVAGSVSRMAAIEGPTFGFVHLLLPHNPYVFDRHGAVVARYPLTIALDQQNRAWRLREPYVEQLKYTNTLLKRMIDDILARSSVPPVIILQGDHGSAISGFAGGTAPHAPEPRERLAILNAYRVPEAMRARLYPGITPVNTFRLLLSTQFGDDLPVLPDSSYSAFYDNPYALRDVTAELHGGAPAVTPAASTSSR
jgi:hypothetical protein